MLLNIININIKIFTGPAHPDRDCKQQIEHLKREAGERKKYEEWHNLNSQAQALFDIIIIKNGWKKCPGPGCPATIERVSLMIIIILIINICVC